jgi:hypothetical protein
MTLKPETLLDLHWQFRILTREEAAMRIPSPWLPSATRFEMTLSGRLGPGVCAIPNP